MIAKNNLKCFCCKGGPCNWFLHVALGRLLRLAAGQVAQIDWGIPPCQERLLLRGAGNEAKRVPSAGKGE